MAEVVRAILVGTEVAAVLLLESAMGKPAIPKKPNIWVGGGRGQMLLKHAQSAKGTFLGHTHIFRAGSFRP